MNKILASLLASAFLLAMLAPALAQSAGTIPNAPLITLTATANNATPVRSATYTNLQSGLACSFLQTAHTSSPSTTMTVDQYDPGTGGYIILGTTTAVTTTDNAMQVIEVYPITAPGSPPTGMVAVGLHSPAQFRVSVTVGGTGSTTAKVGCVGLR